MTRLFMAASITDARRVRASGFEDCAGAFYDVVNFDPPGELSCEFRGAPIPLSNVSGSSGTKHRLTEDESELVKTMVVEGSITENDLVLSIAVPGEEAGHYQSDPGQEFPASSGKYRLFWMSVKIADKYRASLNIWIPDLEESVPVNLID